jgi:hypothetical protein
VASEALRSCVEGLLALDGRLVGILRLDRLLPEADPARL